MTIDELKAAGCDVFISSNSKVGWFCMLGHYMCPEWPQVSAEAPTIEEAVKLATEKALAARKPEMAGHIGVLVIG
jgi:hypothetical protein